MDLGSTAVTVITAPLVQRTRDKSYYRDWGNAVEVTYPGCMLEPFQLSSRLQIQDNQDREFASAYARLWMPPEAVMDNGQRVRVHSQEFDVHGQPILWRDLEDVASHWTVLIYRLEG
jgi:hypothetical protein